MSWNLIIVFFISALGLCLELFLTRILNLKTFNHVVYVIIPFTMLGLGIGSNLYLLSERYVRQFRREHVLGGGLLFLAMTTVLSVWTLIRFPLTVEYLKKLFSDLHTAWMLSLAYLDVMLPFILIGFLLLFLFSQKPQDSYKLYFSDLLGAGCGAVGFFFLINHLEVFRSIIFLSVLSASLGLVTIFPRRRWIGGGFLAMGVLALLIVVPEIQNYKSSDKGWEDFPSEYKKDQYETVFTQWHPLGRTDAYRLKNREDQQKLARLAAGTFEINLVPPPEFTYFTANFLAGTPAYELSAPGLARHQSKIIPFSQGIEVPYLLFHEPRVVIIGSGGGRDIFIAQSHQAREVVAAEINPAIFKAMAKGGSLHDYTGGIYGSTPFGLSQLDREANHPERVEGSSSASNVRAYLADGRYVIKQLPRGQYDLIVLNGVDTYSGLSSGAYTYAESYLYTKEAVQDYLRILDDDGVIFFNRWLFARPRETLRLFAIVLEALRSTGAERPWEHVIIGAHATWGMTMVKKTPFTPQDHARVIRYFSGHETGLIFPSVALHTKAMDRLNYFDQYAVALMSGKEKEFARNYFYDISVITDDEPFFYKYYRLRDFSWERIRAGDRIWGAGYILFLTQAIVLLNAVVFILLFIGLPLLILRKGQLAYAPGHPLAFIGYFALLGMGFMFVEIPLMQQFVLLLGSPIYSISVTLAALLIFSGIGSLFLLRFKEWAGGLQRLVIAALTVLVSLLILLIAFKAGLLEAFVRFPFAIRVMVVCALLAPVGICLGIFFPAGLQLIDERCRGAMAWAWGINFGFSVLGSMLAIILAQFHGFRIILILAIMVYVLAACLYWNLAAATTARRTS